MEFFALMDIAERYMNLVNPSSPEKVLRVGQALGLRPGQRVIDFGCGFGEALALWGERFGISGVGIEIRPLSCERARVKMAARGLSGRIEIVCGSGAEYAFEPHAYDVAVSMGTTFIWGGFAGAVRALKQAARAGGRLVVGEPYWLRDDVPAELAEKQPVHAEPELLQLLRAEGAELEYIVRSSPEDWDRYKSEKWLGLLRWLDENPAHPERQAVRDYLCRDQEEYLRDMRVYIGWAMYILRERG